MLGMFSDKIQVNLGPDFYNSNILVHINDTGRFLFYAVLYNV